MLKTCLYRIKYLHKICEKSYRQVKNYCKFCNINIYTEVQWLIVFNQTDISQKNKTFIYKSPLRITSNQLLNHDI